MSRNTYYPAEDGIAGSRSREFGRRLMKAIIDKGWNQSDLARAAEKHMPEGQKFGRHLVSNWCKGRNMPSPLNLNAMAKALGVDARDLIPDADATFVGDDAPPPVDMKMAPNGKARLKIDIETDFDKAVRIMAILNEKA